MTALLVSMLLQVSACPAEAQPGWPTASAEEKRALLRACLDERFDAPQEQRAVSAPVVLPVPEFAKEPPRAPLPPESDRPSLSDGTRLARLGGSLVGAVVGGLLPAALTQADDRFCGTGCGFGALVLPVSVMAGSALGLLVAGGDPSFLSTVAALLPASMLTLLASAMPGLSAEAHTGALVTAAAVLAFGSAWAQVSRDEHLESLGKGRAAARTPSGRAALTVASGVLLLLPASFAVALATMGCSGCLVPALSLAVVGVVAAEWLVHRSQGGRAPGWAPLVASAGVGLTLLGLFVTGQRSFGSDPRSALLALSGFGVAALVLPAAVFEWSHTREVEESVVPGWWMGAAPVEQGGVVALSARF